VERRLCLIGGIGLGTGLLVYGLRMKAPWACVVGSLGLGLVAASLAGVDLAWWGGGDGQFGPDGSRPGEPIRQGRTDRAPRPAYAGAYI